MAVTYGGALYYGPEVDPSRYYQATMANTPAGDFALFALVKFQALYLGDPGANTSNIVRIAQNFLSGGSGGSDCSLAIVPLNAGTTATRGTLSTRVSSGGFNLLSSGNLTSTTAFANGQTVLVVLQSNAGTIQLKTCIPGGSTVTESTGTRNGSFGVKSLGTWRFGLENFANTLQMFGMAAQAFSDSDIANLAAGTDPETIVTVSGNRLSLWLFDSTAATITAAWGASNATRNGSFASQTAGSPLVPNAAAFVTCTNEPVPYGSIGVNDNGTAPARTWTGTYTGFTPSTFQARIEDTTGTTVQDWTDLSSFSASAGSWSGTLTVPVGGLYRVQFRDKTDTTKTWRGAVPWTACPVHLSTGQSPMTIFEGSGTGGSVPLTGVGYLKFSGVNQVILATQALTSLGLVYAINTFSAAAAGKPIMFILAAVSGTSSVQWSSKDALVWPQLLASLDYAKPQRVLVSWLNGAAEASLTTSQIQTNHTTILSNFDADVVTTRGIGYRYRMITHQRATDTTLSNQKIRSAQYLWATGHSQFGSKVLLGPWWPDCQLDTEYKATAQGGGASTITLAASDLGSYGSVCTIVIVSGTGAGQTRAVSSTNTSTKVLTVTTPWTTAPDATSVYKTYGPSPHQQVINGTDRFGPRNGQDIAACFGYTTLSGKGPTGASATYPNGGDGSIIDVVFSHRHGANLRTPNGGTSATGLAGFEVSEDAFTNFKTITSQAITGPQTVRLTLSAPPSNKANLVVRYGGSSPVDGPNWDAVGGVGGLGDLLYDDSGVAPFSGLPAFLTPNPLAATEAPSGSSVLIDSGFWTD